MKKGKQHKKRLGATAVGIDLGEERSETTYLSAEGDVLDRFSFTMDDPGYEEFSRRTLSAPGRFPSEINRHRHRNAS
jgi:hypothetical protein